MDYATIMPYFIAVLALTAAPGPLMAVLIVRSLGSDSKGAVGFAAGLCAGDVLAAIAVALGIGVWAQSKPELMMLGLSFVARSRTVEQPFGHGVRQAAKGRLARLRWRRAGALPWQSVDASDLHAAAADHRACRLWRLRAIGAGGLGHICSCRRGFLRHNPAGAPAQRHHINAGLVALVRPHHFGHDGVDLGLDPCGLTSVRSG
jgi:hypothetical protein